MDANNLGDVAWDDASGLQQGVIWPFWPYVMRILGQFLLENKKSGAFTHQKVVSGANLVL